MCSSRFVDPPNAAWSSIAFSIACCVRIVDERNPLLDEPHERAGRAARHVEPDRLAGRAERAVRQRHPERLGHHLRRRRGPEELAAAAGRAAGPAAHRRRVVDRDEAVREARANRLDLAGVLAVDRRQRDAAGDDDAGQMAAAGQRQHRGGQPLVAGRDADHAGAPRQRSNQTPHRDRRVVAIRQAVEHPGGALRPAVARIAAVRGERHDARLAQRLGRRPDQQADLPVPGVESQRDRPSVGARAGRPAC